MEFNRLLSSVISMYGEPSLSHKTMDSVQKEEHTSINKKNYYLI